MQVRMLLERFDEAGLNPVLQKRVSDEILSRRLDHLAYDSRDVGSGGAFFAIRGSSTDGHLFIDKAVQQGALLVICESAQQSTSRSYALVVVNDSRRALSEAAAGFFGDPSVELFMTGVTGTNGKTTTAHLIHHLLQDAGKKSGLIGTIGIQIGDERREVKLTTPDPIQLNQALSDMLDAGCFACVMEVSSHALAQHRTKAIAFDAAVFMNLSQDHLDYHGSMDQYLRAKKVLFDDLSPKAEAIYNIDDPVGEKIVADSKAHKTSFGTVHSADVHVEIVENVLDGLLLAIDGRERRFRLVGEFNAYNLAAAYAIGRALGISQGDAIEALADASSVAGRFEQLQAPDGLRAIVDYAHTPDALENVLCTIRGAASPDVKVWCVFGCGGDRDRGKRPQMGRIAERWADHVVITSDNPRSEDPEVINAEILGGLASPETALVIADRREAIRTAITQAAANDVVLIAGKGHETSQIINDEKRHFDDREEVIRHFTKREPLS